MFNRKRTKVGLALLLICLSLGIVAEGSGDGWKQLDKGLYFREFDSPVKSTIGDSRITVVKVDPSYYSFKLLTISEYGGQAKTSKEWAKEHGLLVVVNAGMFQVDGSTHVGHMKNYSSVNNPRVLKSYKSIFAFNPAVPAVPEATLIDLDCQAFDNFKDKYNTFVQNIRMIDCKQKNVWSRQSGNWSMVVLAEDTKGNILFIYTGTPYTVHDFIDILLKLPLSIQGATYLEGGRLASLYVSVNGFEADKYGIYNSSGDVSGNAGNQAWPIPNVIGVVKKNASNNKAGANGKAGSNGKAGLNNKGK